jgi:hypothetical protein
MVCPQQRLRTLLNTNNNNHHRNSICVELSGCPTDESSTDDYCFIKSSSNRYWNKSSYSRMSNIAEHDRFPSDESINEKRIGEGKIKKKQIFVYVNQYTICFFSIIIT